MTTCRLCDLPVSDAVTDDSVEGVFCCRGCLEVQRSLGDVAVSDTHTGESTTSIPEDAATTYFVMEGMHCATCEVYLESVANDCDGVYNAEASYAAEAMKLSYDPDTLSTETLRDTLSRTGYTASRRDADGTDTETDTLENRLIVGAALGMMAMLAYVVFLYPRYFGYEPLVALESEDSAHIYGHLAALSAILLLYTGAPILRGAYVSVRTRRPNVDLLVTTAALAAYAYSTGRLLTGHADLYYDVTVVVVLAVTAGTYYEGRIRSRMNGLLTDLTPLQSETAIRENGEVISVDAVETGDRLLVRAGERVPVDGVVRDGSGAVDEALVTGESLPENKAPGDTVIGGTVVTDTPLLIEATGTDSRLDRIVDSLWEVQTARSGAQRFADRLATVFVPLVFFLAVGASVLGLFAGESVQTALLTSLTLLIVSCPCALGLATPLAVASGLRSAAERGVVITTPALFEHVGSVDTVVFDKTGTVTNGEMAVSDVFTTDETTENRLLARAAAVEQYTAHPIARAVTEAAPGVRSDGGTTVPTDTAATDPASPAGDTKLADSVGSVVRHSRGVSATVDGMSVLVGHPDLFTEKGWEIDDALADRTESITTEGNVPVIVGWDGCARGVIAVGDEARDEWAAVATELGDRTVILTGDEGPATQRLAEHPAVDRVFAGIRPDGKAETIRRLAATGTVAMVGDGSNDAPALAAADVGIALEDGTKLAVDAADAVVLNDDLGRLPTVFDVAVATRRRIRENLVWAFVYNGIAIPLALFGFLNPLFAALAMATSSVLVVANSARTAG
ncbi:heavy metal translocating P-type ATPase [Halovenus rubra]|uniref:Heavy metal translocating P-type ATPase n=2 Tax=Halovenus rubra TaxID=869890 RepID=A0ABD5X8I1_9EURY|nr:cation-translocating P-type ATPase [Halovenus rubra]